MYKNWFITIKRGVLAPPPVKGKAGRGLSFSSFQSMRSDSIYFAVDKLRQNEEDMPWLIPSDFSIRE